MYYKSYFNEICIICSSKFNGNYSVFRTYSRDRATGIKRAEKTSTVYKSVVNFYLDKGLSKPILLQLKDIGKEGGRIDQLIQDKT